MLTQGALFRKDSGEDNGRSTQGEELDSPAWCWVEARSGWGSDHCMWQSLHLLLTNYQQGTICYRQDNPDVERGIRIIGCKMTQAVTLKVFERTCWVNGRKLKVRERRSWLGIIRLTHSSASDFPTAPSRSCSIYILFDNSGMGFGLSPVKFWFCPLPAWSRMRTTPFKKFALRERWFSRLWFRAASLSEPGLQDFECWTNPSPRTVQL